MGTAVMLQFTQVKETVNIEKQLKKNAVITPQTITWLRNAATEA